MSRTDPRTLRCGDSSQHPLVRWAAQLTDSAQRRALDAEPYRMAGARWRCPTSIDPLKVDFARVADVMSISLRRDARALRWLSACTRSRWPPASRSTPRGCRDRGPHQEAVRLVLAHPSTAALHAEFYSRRARCARGQARETARWPASSSSSRWARATTLDANDQGVCRSSTGFGSTPSTSAPATSTSSRGARWLIRFASTGAAHRLQVRSR